MSVQPKTFVQVPAGTVVARFNTVTPAFPLGAKYISINSEQDLVIEEEEVRVFVVGKDPSHQPFEIGWNTTNNEEPPVLQWREETLPGMLWMEVDTANRITDNNGNHYARIRAEIQF